MHDAMNDDSRLRIRRATESALAIGLIVFRLLRCPPAELWRDWMLILGAYWIFCIWGRRSRLWPTLTLVLMSLLLAIYLHGQFRHTLGSWRFLSS